MLGAYVSSMTSKKDVYTWIADYACKHRLEDIITDVFKGVDGDMLSYRDISHVNLKNALVWVTVKNDCQEEFEEAIAAVDSLLDAAVAANSLEVFVRLSLGLRLRDLFDSLSLPLDTLEMKLARHFPGSKFQLDQKYFSQLFSDNELDDFESSVAGVCNYFRALGRSEEQKLGCSAVDPRCQFGVRLSQSLESLTKQLFDTLMDTQPLGRLEQIVKSGVKNLQMHDSSPWQEWLLDRLSGVHSLDDELVRGLMASLQWHEAVGHASSAVLAARKTGLKRKLRSSTKVTKPNAGREINQVMLMNRRVHERINESEDGGASDLQARLVFVPSSQGEHDSLVRKTFGDKIRKYSEDYRLPNLKQFLKQDGIRGCVVKLSRI